jgi:hypothetical protein
MKIWFIIILLQIQYIVAFISSTSFNNIKQFSINNKQNKIISIAPAGLGGFYLLGIISYIKQHYNTSDYTIIGASAGAWVSLPMIYNGNINTFVDDIMTNYSHSYLNISHDDTSNMWALFDIQYSLQRIILSSYKTSDFDLSRLNIATSVLNINGLRHIIINNIHDIESAIKYCFASSHIPFVTGNGLFRINNALFFDGGLFKFPPSSISTYFTISSDMWGYHVSDIFTIKKYSNNGIIELYKKGYEDTKDHKYILDLYFTEI